MQQRMGLFIRQPSEETEHISDPSPQSQGAWDVFGEEYRVVRGAGEGVWRQEKGEVMSALCRRIRVTCFFMGCLLRKCWC